MLSLLIETSTERGLVAILDDLSPITQIDLPFGFNNSKYLLPAIQSCFNQSNLALKQMSHIIVGIGPGSYTGIRVGAITAKSLAYACQIPLIGVSSLEGFVPSENALFMAMIDAKIGGVYFLKGEKKNNGIIRLSEPSICELEALDMQMEGVTHIVTPYCAQLRKKLHDLYPNASWEWEERSPCPRQLAQSALTKIKVGQSSLDTNLDLLYLRKTQAEIEKGQRTKRTIIHL